MKPVNVAEFKAHLGRFLRMVREGKLVVVADRGTPVAVVVPFVEPHAARLEIRKATRPWSDLARMRFTPPERGAVDPLQALLEDRSERPR